MYYSLRITPSKFNTDFKKTLFIIKKILKRKDTDNSLYIFADEKINKFGEETHRHWHFNFISDTTKESLRRWILRQFADREMKITGNDSYSFSDYAEPDDIKRWVRYLMKEKWVPSLSKLDEFSAEDIQNMELMAKDERKRSIEFQIKKREQHNSKKTVLDRLKKHFEKKDLKTFRDVWLEISKWYQSEGLAGDPRTMDRYSYQILLHSKIITHEEFFDMTH